MKIEFPLWFAISQLHVQWFSFGDEPYVLACCTNSNDINECDLAKIYTTRSLINIMMMFRLLK